VERQPVLIRISVAKRLRDEAERAARRAGERSVTLERFQVATQALSGEAVT
jgi:chlorophyllide a reductase subunit Z